MANQKITDDAAVVTPAGTDVFPVVQAGANKKMTLAQIATFAGGAGGAALPRNYLINGDFDIWLRGNSATADGYLADRWFNLISGSTATYSRQAFAVGQSDVPDNPQYYHRAAVVTGAGAGDIAYTRQSIENVRHFSGETVTLSFWAKADAGKDIVTSFRQYFGTGGSPSAEVVVDVTTHTLTTAWQKFEIQIAVPSISGKTIGTSLTDNLRLEFVYEAGSGFTDVNSIGNQSGTFDISHVQIERSSTAFDFEQRSIGTEQELCRRYARELVDQDILATEFIATGQCLSSTSASIPLDVSGMRAAPIVTLSAAGTFDVQNISGSAIACTVIAASTISKTSFRILATVASGLGVGNATILRSDSTPASILVSAEL